MKRNIMRKILQKSQITKSAIRNFFDDPQNNKIKTKLKIKIESFGETIRLVILSKLSYRRNFLMENIMSFHFLIIFSNQQSSL